VYFYAEWGNEDTQDLINILAKYNVKATFFVVGEWVDKYPESVKALSDAGHFVMNHSNTHPHLPQLSQDQIIEEINTCNDKIEKVTGVRPNMVRVPYGDYSDKVVSTLRELGQYTIQWDVDSLDWKNLQPSEIQNRVLSKVKSGSIVLFHNAAANTPAALPSIIEQLQGQGYELVPVIELIYKEDFTIENDGTQVQSKSKGE
jgi:peptidoglycan/xylan/chitin deacetylase (PgdA/CDA1 family)